MTINKKLRNAAIYHRVNLIGYENNLIRESLKLLDIVDKELTAQLYVALEDLSPSDFKISRLESILASSKSLKSITDYLFGELNSLSEHESNYQYSLFESLLPDIVKSKYPLMQIPPNQIFTAVKAKPFQGRLLSEWASNIEDDRLKRVANSVRTGYATGETTEQIIRRVRGTKKNKYKDGVLEASKRNVSSVIRSAVSHTAAIARESFGNANSDIIKGKQWLSTLDTSTTPMCMIRDLKEYTLDNTPIGHDIPYGDGPGKLHFCCRSVETFILKSYRELGINIDEAPSGTRASMDGQVPAKTSYFEWLKTQSQERQEQILGIERARLLRDGEIAPENFFTRDGHLLTLEQLKNRECIVDSTVNLKTIEDIENWMVKKKIADSVQFPKGTSLESAKEVAEISSDIIRRFNLPKLSWLGTKEGFSDSAAGAYYISQNSIHMASWMLDASEWEAIAENAAMLGYKDVVIHELVLSPDKKQLAKIISSLDILPYASVQSIKGTIAHEFGHYLYYQDERYLSQITQTAYNDKWAYVLSYYSSDSNEELFSESFALYMLGDEKSKNRIHPLILEWFKKHDKR